MASSSEDFPDPVGPLMANTSSSPKSSSTGSRKAVNPLMESFSGRMGSPGGVLLEELVQGPQEVVGNVVHAVFPAVVGHELVPGLERRQPGPLLGALHPLVPEAHVHGVRQGVSNPL